jgi:hypothetical protein
MNGVAAGTTFRSLTPGWQIGVWIADGVVALILIGLIVLMIIKKLKKAA